MKISLSQHNQRNSYPSMGNRNKINEYSGLNVIKQYQKEFERVENKNAQKEAESKNVIYNALDELALLGKYNAVKTLFKELENEPDLKQDYNLYSLAGNVYEKQGDIEKANKLYRDAFVNTPVTEGLDLLKIEKKYMETKSLLGIEDGEEIKNLLKYKAPIVTVNYLDLSSLMNLKNNKIEESKNDIKAEYELAKNNQILDEELNMKMATVLYSDGNYEQSIQLCTDRLDNLQEEKRVFTEEFVYYLNLLGLNKYEVLPKADDDKIINIFNNASKISEKIGNKNIKKMVDYNLIRSYFEGNNDEFVSLAEAFLTEENNDNNKYSVNVFTMLGDYYLHSNKSEANKHYILARGHLLNSDEKDEKMLLYIYEKMKIICPEFSSEIDKEIQKLEDKGLLSTNNLILALEGCANSKNWEGAKKISEKVFESEKTNPLHKEIARTYNVFANIESGHNFEKELRYLDENLEKIYDAYGSNKENQDIIKHLYNSYSRVSAILYNSMNYSQAADKYEKADKFLQMIKPSETASHKSKIALTMMNYKAKNYYSADKYCSQYLQQLLTKQDNDDTQSRKIASAYETLGVINMKNKNFADSKKYFIEAIKIREKLKDKDLQLANSYAALARIAVVTNWKAVVRLNTIKSEKMHTKSLNILKEKYPDSKITKDEQAFHDKYYGRSIVSVAKYIFPRDKKNIINNFQCYNSELSICE